MLTFLDDHLDVSQAGFGLLVCYVHLGGIGTHDHLPEKNTAAYLAACRGKTLTLGGVLFVRCAADSWIANAAVRYRLTSKPMVAPVVRAMANIRAFADRHGPFTVGMPHARGIGIETFQTIVRAHWRTSDSTIIVSPPPPGI